VGEAALGREGGVIEACGTQSGLATPSTLDDRHAVKIAHVLSIVNYPDHFGKHFSGRRRRNLY
jgi:hypothetical protein